MRLSVDRLTVRMGVWRRCVVSLVLSGLSWGCGHEQVSGTSLSPEAFIATARLPEDVRLELVASEPAVVDPVGLAFDADGRMYVVEMGGYPSRPETSLPMGRVKRLEDLDLDGYFETWTVFAENLQYPTSVLPWRDGVLVTQPPDILWLRDTDDDGVADVREALFSGFPVENTQHNINGLIWGLDNWVYAANGGNGGSGYPVGSGSEPVSIRGLDFRFHPSTRVMAPSFETTGGHGIAFDAWGRMFGTHNVNHVQHMVFPVSYLQRNPWFSVSTTRDMISDHGQSATLFQVSDAQTRVNNPNQSGRFSGGSGIAYYGGGGLPARYEGSLFVNDVVVNVVHQDVLRPEGPSFVASRSAEGLELLAGRDNWFRPVSLSTGPDGALYVVDMHRGVIEHPEWIPDVVEATLDLRAGDDKGRIYRIVPQDGVPRARPALGDAPLQTLVDVLAHPNKWWRDTAQRILVERGDVEAAPLLRALFHTTDQPLGRVHALWTLSGLGALQGDDVRRAFEDPESGVRENAGVMAEGFLSDPGVLEALASKSGDPDARVRLHAALTLGGGDTSAAREALQAILVKDVEAEWIRTAVLSAVEPGDSGWLAAVLDGAGEARGGTVQPGALAAARQLAAMGVSAAGPENAARLRRLVDRASSRALDDAVRSALLDGAADGLAAAATPWREGATLARALERLLEWPESSVVRAAARIAVAVDLPGLPALRRAIVRAAGRALNDTTEVSLDERIAEIALLGLGPYELVSNPLLALMEPQAPPVLQVAAARALAASDAPERGGVMLDGWRRYAPAVKTVVLDMLLGHQPFHGLLLSALEGGRLGVGELNLDFGQRRRLLYRSTADIQRRASAFFGDHEFSNRQAVVDEWLPEVLGRAGDPDQGEEHFATLCAPCHLFRGVGHPVGPDLGMAFARGREDLLTSILDPSAAFAPEYANYLIETTDGELLNGILIAETANSLTVVRGNGERDVLSRDGIREFRAEGRSLMPDGLEQGLDGDGLADLLAYLRTHEH